MTPQEYLEAHSLKENFVLERGWELKENRIAIPIFNPEGKFIYNKYRELQGDSKFTADAGSHPALYMADQIARYKEIVLCEGEPDCIRLWQEGIPAVTGTFGVATFSESVAEPLRGKIVYVCLDTDEAGQKAIEKYCDILKKIEATPLIIGLPKEFKDVSEYFTSNKTKEDFKKLKESATPPPTPQDKFPIVSASEFVTKEFPPSSWIIKGLIKKGGISFIVGESGTGKTIASLSMVKAISLGEPWINKFPTEQMKVLILDKENSPADIQTLYKSMGIRNDNIFTYFTEEDYNLITEEGEMTEIGQYIHDFIKEKDIGLVVIDSAIDFLIGDENSSVIVASNINKWREVCGEASILSIHHESKQDPRNKKKAMDRTRGSTVWVSAAQSIISISVISLGSPEKLMVEHTKVRGARKLKPFEMDMIIRPSPTKEGETIVDGYKYIKELDTVKLVGDKTKEAIIEFFEKHIGTTFTAKEVYDEIGSEDIKQKNIGYALPELVRDGDLVKESNCGPRGNAFGYKMCVSNVLEKIENGGSI